MRLLASGFVFNMFRRMDGGFLTDCPLANEQEPIYLLEALPLSTPIDGLVFL